MRASTEMRDSPSTLEQCRRSKRRWLIAQWSFVFLLTISIIVGLGGPVARLKQTIVMANNQSISDSSYEQMIQRTLLVGKLGLVIGVVAFLGYLFAAIMHHRSKLKLQQARDLTSHPGKRKLPDKSEDLT